MKYRTVLPCALLLILGLVLPGCDSQRETPPPVTGIKSAPAAPQIAATPKKPFQEPMEPTLYELPSGALATWRDHADQKPALILFSSHPFLTPLYDGDRKAIRDLVLTAPAADIVRRGRFWSADPLFFPPQTVSAAIDAELFSEVIFVRPTSKNVEELSLAEFRDQSLAAGFIDKREALALTLNEGVITGTVRGTPLRVAHPLRIPKPSKPVIIHFDLSYFAELYINEIKTPVYDLLYATVLDVKDADPSALAVTFSYSNQEATYGLESRFMINDLAAILEHPRYLDETTPASWTLRAGALYAGAMFAESRARELTVQAATANPDDPAALFALAIRHLSQGREAEGFATLDQAAALDRGYALAYLDLAMTGLAMGKSDKAIELVRKATEAFPENSITRVDLAYLLIEGDRRKEALVLLKELEALPWSAVFHPETLKLIQEMKSIAQSDDLSLRFKMAPGQGTRLPASSEKIPTFGQ
jgi:hypothetical protein